MFHSSNTPILEERMSGQTADRKAKMPTNNEEPLVISDEEEGSDVVRDRAIQTSMRAALPIGMLILCHGSMSFPRMCES